MNDLSGFRAFIVNELAKRKQKNPRYSLRAFSRDLKVKHGRMSEYISGKRNPSLKTLIKFARLLNCPVREFYNEQGLVVDAFEIEQETFAVISDWYHFAILSLVQTDNFKNNFGWISKRLGISKFEAQSAVNRLLKLNLLVNKGGRLSRTHQKLKTITDVEFQALKHSHRQSIEQAAACLDSVDVIKRDITSITMPIDPEKIGKAKKIIRRLRQEISDLLESGKKTEVYNLNIQLVPVTRGGTT